MKKLAFIFAFVFLGASVALAQGYSDNPIISQVGQNQGGEGSFNYQGPELLGLFTHSPFFADLQGLIVDANQVARIKIEGDGNTASLTQSGSNNVGMINIDGNSNSASLLQDGNGLFSLIDVEGNANNLDVDQVGSSLQNLIILNGNGLDFGITQNASGLEVTQAGSSIPLMVRSTSRFIPLIIKSN